MNTDNSLFMEASTSAAVAASYASFSTLEAALAPVGPALGDNVIDTGLELT